MYNPEVKQQNLQTFCLEAFLSIYNIHKKYTDILRIVWYFGKYAYSLNFVCDMKIDVILMSVCWEWSWSQEMISLA